MRELLGGKGANLAEMASLACRYRRVSRSRPSSAPITTTMARPIPMTGSGMAARRASRGVGRRQVRRPDNPLLVSVRSGARVSMPGMMDTVLNLGLNDVTR